VHFWSYLLLDAEATAPRLDELAQHDQLRRFRYLHFATHGEVNDRVALQSALILAPDPRPVATGPPETAETASDG
jgi:hypothetical protein